MNTTTNYGDLVYEYTADLTGVTEFGASMRDFMVGSAPPSGLRLDIAFEGECQGRLAGRIQGIDYLNIRADGRMELDIRAVLTTPEGCRIALVAGGVGIPQPGDTITLLRENVKLTTAHPEYAWVNPLEFWAIGEADLDKRQVHIRGYIPR